jgi:hypothetical protein
LNITYLPYKQIHKDKWDNCIKNAVNGLIYARSFYLDAMAGSWDAIVAGDYEAVMPLTWKTKWGIRYLYQPAFIQQGGVFSRDHLNRELIQDMLDKAFSEFPFAEITLNHGNEIKSATAPLQTSLRNNFILNLQRSYEQLYENYDASFTKSLRRIKKFELQYAASGDHKKIIKLYKDLYSKRLPFFSGKDFLRIENICRQLATEGNLISRNVTNAGNELLAAVILLKDEKRLYNIISCITEAGKKLETNYFLYDRVIHEFAGTSLVLDLEGSDVPGIADFYRKFNPENQPYPFIKYNKLHPLIRIFKQ